MASREGVRLSEIRSAEAYLARRLRTRRPFATEPIATDGINTLFQASPSIEGQLTAANRGGQEILRRALGNTLRGLNYDECYATSWDIAESVRIDPGIQFGAPCVAGTRVPTAQIIALREAGDEPSGIADFYDLSLETIENALTF